MKSSGTSRLSQDPENPVLVAYDVELMRPGCAIVQVALGGTISGQDLARMDDWLLHPTDDMRLYTVNGRDEMERLIALTNGKEKS